jgi:hypothetical protein
MRLPQREYYTVHEVATRWGCTIADIAGWSSKGRLDIVTGIPPVTCGGDIIAGEVVVSAFDILPMFRRCGTGPQSAFVRRVRANGSTDWSLITEPAVGVEVSIADLLITGQQVQKFEDDHELMRRIAGGSGSTSPYDWDGMTSALIVRIHEKGLPASQSELIEDMQAWFAEQSADGQFPDERSIRRRISSVWKTLSQLRKSA